MAKKNQSWSLRRNRPGIKSPGSYKLRLTVQLDPGQSGRQIEAGLGTTDKDEADIRARAVVKILEDIVMLKHSIDNDSPDFVRKKNKGAQ